MFDEYTSLLDDSPFDELPVDVKEFVESEKFLNQPPLSKYQYHLVEAMSQIYKEEDLARFMGSKDAVKHFKRWTKTEVIMALGKGSGKDHTSTIGVAYTVYKLLCLKDPARYYGKPPGDAIDIINIAINAQQARNVFFKGFMNKIRRSEWFAGKYYAKNDSVEFDKAITVYSGHSERESHEGLNLFTAVLDEISGFGEGTALNDRGKTGANIYKAFRGTVDSRFPDYGKVILLSFPRYEGDFISTKYDQAVATKDVIKREHTFILNSNLPPEANGNSFTIDWEEDHITGYVADRVYALKRPTWEVNPTRDIEDFKMAFYTDPADAKMRFLCMPTISSDAFFRSKEKIQQAMSIRNPVDSNKLIDLSWQHDHSKVYYVHADLAQVHDKCAVAVSHVEKWVTIEHTENFSQTVPFVVVDMIAWWEPRKEGPVNLSEVKHWIQGLRQRGINVGLTTFDRWHSYDIQKELRDFGMATETLSVAKKHYEDLAMLIYEDRIVLPDIPLLLEEMTELKIIKQNKVDHPRKSCFTGDTMIPLLDGTDQELHALDGSTVWVYAYDIENDVPVPAQAYVAKTGERNHLVRIVLDSGAVIKCTPDHLFLLRNGVYKEAQHLRPGVDRLMPLNRFWPHNGGYEAISVKDHKQPTHRYVAEYIYGNVFGTDNVVHHKDGNKTNNVPDNLEVLSREEHSSHHGIQDFTEHKRMAMSRGTIEFNRLASTRQARSEHARSLPKEEYVRRSKLRKQYRSDITIDRLLEVAADAEATNANMASKILGCGRNVVMRVLREHGYDSWNELLTGAGDNHRVRSITHVVLDNPEPIYDLEVPEYHNFALTAGVYVHNSKDLADAMCGSVFNAISRTPRNVDQEIEIHTPTRTRIQKPEDTKPPEITPEVQDYLSGLGLL